MWSIWAPLVGINCPWIVALQLQRVTKNMPAQIKVVVQNGRMSSTFDSFVVVSTDFVFKSEEQPEILIVRIEGDSPIQKCNTVLPIISFYDRAPETNDGNQSCADGKNDLAAGLGPSGGEFRHAPS